MKGLEQKIDENEKAIQQFVDKVDNLGASHIDESTDCSSDLKGISEAHYSRSKKRKLEDESCWITQLQCKEESKKLARNDQD